MRITTKEISLAYEIDMAFLSAKYGFNKSTSKALIKDIQDGNFESRATYCSPTKTTEG